MRVYDLPFAKFELAAPLLHQSWFDEAYIDMVLEGIQPGRIFVDHPDHPTAALLCHPYEFYVVGDSSPANPLRRFIKDHPAEPDIFHTLYGYCPVGAAWEAALLEDQPLLKIIPRRNFKYRHPASFIDWRALLPAGAELRQVDADLVAHIEARYPGRFTGYWNNSISAFLKHAFGFCLLVDGQIACMVDAGGISSDYANLGVLTIDAFRQRGFASLTCSAAIEHSLMLGKLPTWDCDLRNTNSAALAQKIGFSEEAPFRQLSPEYGTSLPLSTGRWTKGDTLDEMVVWNTTS